ncbi:fungal-specific transcription factor domain-containing protein [Aspergillus insuetus]
MVRNSKTACHTCRRRRLRCDEAKPHCQRCAAEGVECLGYGKMILWVDGVASRGKMMGKSFSEESIITQASQVEPAPASNAETSNQLSTSRHGHDNHVVVSPTPSTLYSPLLEPWLQQMDYNTRHYLAHFLTNVGNDLIVHNLPSHQPNPLRVLLEFSQQSSALFNVIIAMSAHHQHNLLLGTPDAHTHQIHGLLCKGKALQLLGREITQLSPSNYTTLLASSMLLSEMALLELGDDTWRIHVGAAARLVRGITLSSSSLAPDGMSVEASTFCSWMISRLVIQDMFGSSLSAITANCDLQQVWGPGRGIGGALRIAELDHYSSCPAQISQLILAASALPAIRPTHGSVCEDRGRGPATQCIFLSIQQFDPGDWALTLQSRTPTDDFTERYHIASAYKAAAALYISQIIPDDDHTCAHRPTQPHALVHNILSHISLIPRSNPLFKSSIWPVCIAGAETADPQHRAAVLSHLRTLSIEIRWQSTYGAEQALKAFWEWIDKLPEPEPHRARRWLEEFRSMGVSIYPA